MCYMDSLRGTTRTIAPAVKVGSFETRTDARRIAAARAHHDFEDSASFRATRSLMANRTGVCG